MCNGIRWGDFDQSVLAGSSLVLSDGSEAPVGDQKFCRLERIDYWRSRAQGPVLVPADFIHEGGRLNPERRQSVRVVRDTPVGPRAVTRIRTFKGFQAGIWIPVPRGFQIAGLRFDDGVAVWTIGQEISQSSPERDYLLKMEPRLEEIFAGINRAKTFYQEVFAHHSRAPLLRAA